MSKFQEWNQRFRAVFQREEGAPPDAQAAADSIQTAGIAVLDSDGRICVDVAAEEDIDIKALRSRHSTVLDTDEAAETTKEPVRQEDEPLVVPPKMTVCIMIVGTRGDVQPFIGIAKRLQQDGHRVRLATHAVYREFVTEHDVEFYPLGGDPKELAAYMVKTGGHLIPLKLETIQKDVPRNMQMIEEILNSTWPAVAAADPDAEGVGCPGKPFKAQAIISNPVTYGHIHVAERLGVPLHIMFPQPWVPTEKFPHPLSNLPYTGKSQKRNYLSYKLVDLLMWQGTERMVNHFRTDVLGLRKIRKGDGGRDILLDLEIPHAFMWSPHLVPKPPDWGNIYDVIGTVVLKADTSSYTPTPGLEAFLTEGDEPPIFVGFGSMILAEPAATTKMIMEAAQRANVRVLIQSSWSDMAGDVIVPDHVFFIGNCPHDWLLPRVHAVVHHGGAGTTAAGLLAGKPTFIVPFFGDQPFWGRAVVDAGVGVEPCPIAQLTMEKLQSAFEDFKDPDLHTRAMAMRSAMLREDGVEEAVRSFYRHLPVQRMLCDLGCQRIATKWSIADELRLCDRCDYAVSSRPENYWKKVVDYHYVDYTARGPESGFAGASAGTASFFHEIGGAVADIVVEPARGYREEGPIGAVIGVARGISGLLIRPIHGVALFADQLVVGHVNQFREQGRRRRRSIFDEQIMTAMGQESGLADTYAATLEPFEAKSRLLNQKMRRKIMLSISDEDRTTYQTKFAEIMKARSREPVLSDRIKVEEPIVASPPGTCAEATNGVGEPNDMITVENARITSGGNVDVAFSVQFDEADTIDDLKMQEWLQYSARQKKRAANLLDDFAERAVPPMNICLATIGTWDNNVKQFVAVGLRLKADGHRVRLAANKKFRDQITSRGLEFYPLGGAAENFDELMKQLHDAQTTNIFFKYTGIEPSVVGDVKELIFSLYPAANGIDPHGNGENIPGELFRADVLLWHPLLLGHVHVAERLGIPLQCLSLEPLSPTFEFPHLLSSLFTHAGDESALKPEFAYKETNWLSYGVVDTMVWRAIVTILNQFRASMGLTGRSYRPSPLIDFQIPHIYLWNPYLLEKPLDWGAELTVAGYTTLEDSFEVSKQRTFRRHRSFNDFTLSTGNPVIYFAVPSSHYDKRSLIRPLLKKIDDAARRTQVQIIFQVDKGTDNQDNSSLYHSDNVYEVEPECPFTLLARKVVALIHWGEPSMLAEGLAAGKPTCVCPHSSAHQFSAWMTVKARVGVPSVDLDNCTVETLVSLFEALMNEELSKKAKELGPTFSSELTLERVAEAFYSHLPLLAMTCDLDENKIARVYDTQHELKLSYEANLAIQPLLQRTHSVNDVVAYRPLVYQGDRPPKCSLRGFDAPGDAEETAKPLRAFESLASFTLFTLMPWDPPASWVDPAPAPPPRLALTRFSSQAPLIVEKPKFWMSVEDEVAERQRIYAAYDEKMDGRETALPPSIV